MALKQKPNSKRNTPRLSSKMISFEPQTPNQEKFVRNIDNNVVSFGIGFPGTGKTFVALAIALKALLDNKCERVLITRPMVESSAKIGFVPGTEEDKLGVFLKHIYDMIYKLLPGEVADNLFDSGKIVIGAIAFMRGMNFENCYVIVDEAENLNQKEFYLLLTRICTGSKVIFSGDTGQIDLINKFESGLADALTKFRNKPGFSVTEFKIEDCRRDPIVMEVIKAYFPVEKEEPIKEEIEPIQDPRLPKKKK